MLMTNGNGLSSMSKKPMARAIGVKAKVALLAVDFRSR